MKYKVGDKVKIRSDLKGDFNYGGQYFSKRMESLFLGKIFTINIVNDGYRMKEIMEDYYFTDEMIEGKVEDMITYKGWAILKMIADGELKEGTRIKSENERIFYFTNNRVFRDVETNELLTEVFNEYELATEDFEIIEDQEEINIQEIKETKIDEHGFLQTHLGAFKGRKMDLAFNDRINELVQAVKELDKKIKEKE